MAKTLTRPANPGLYEEDFPVWAERQAALLRARRFDQLDLDNLIEEVEDLSRREREAVESLLETVVEHLLKLMLSSSVRPRRQWLNTVDRQRAKLRRKLTASLRSHLASKLPDLYQDLRRPVARALAQDQVILGAVPLACPFTLDQILDPDWFPGNVHGLKDPAP
jgi:hypothetical protein